MLRLASGSTGRHYFVVSVEPTFCERFSRFLLTNHHQSNCDAQPEGTCLCSLQYAPKVEQRLFLQQSCMHVSPFPAEIQSHVILPDPT